MNRVKLEKGFSYSDMKELENIGIPVVEFEFFNENQQRTFEYHAVCTSDEQKKEAFKMNKKIIERGIYG